MGTLLERLLALDFGRLMGVVAGGGFHRLAKRPAPGHRLRHGGVVHPRGSSVRDDR